jgi:hypothetical protein
MIENDESSIYDFQEELSKIYIKFVEKQERLPPDFEKVFAENIEDLYEE